MLLSTITVETTITVRHSDDLNPDVLVNLLASPAFMQSVAEADERPLDLGTLRAYVEWVREDDPEDAEEVDEAMPELEQAEIRGYAIEGKLVATEDVIA
jgi:hypothetical protein